MEILSGEKYVGCNYFALEVKTTAKERETKYKMNTFFEKTCIRVGFNLYLKQDSLMLL